MKVLSIAWYKVLPPRYGGQKGIANFNKCLARHFPLTFLCSKDNESAVEAGYRVLPLLPFNKFQFINPLVIKKIVSAAKKEKPTHIILEHPYHGIAAFKAAKRAGAKLIVHSHNIESERFRKMGKWWWRALRMYEKWGHRKADLNLFKTKEDMDYALKYFELNQEKCIVIPYGIDPERKKAPENAKKIIRDRHDILPDEKIILFSGTLDYLPNAKAVENIFQEIAPRLTDEKFLFKIIITGRINKSGFNYLNKLTNPDIIMAGEVSDIENYFAAADIFINPAIEGGGIQTKIIDALSYDLNVVCFADVLNGIEVNLSKEKIFIVTPGSWQEFIQQIKNAADYTQKTPGSFLNYYNWENIISRLIAKIEKP